MRVLVAGLIGGAKIEISAIAVKRSTPKIITGRQ